MYCVYCGKRLTDNQEYDFRNLEWVSSEHFIGYVSSEVADYLGELSVFLDALAEELI